MAQQRMAKPFEPPLHLDCSLTTDHWRLITDH